MCWCTLKTKLVYYLVYIYRLLRNCILSGCHFGTGIIIRHNVKSWLLCVIYWPFHMKIILPIGEINFLQEIFKNPKGFSRIIFRIKQKVFLQEFYSNKYFFFIGNRDFKSDFKILREFCTNPTWISISYGKIFSCKFIF